MILETSMGNQIQTQMTGKTSKLDLPTNDTPKVIARLIVQGANNSKIKDLTVNLIRDRGIKPYPFSIDVLNVIYEYCNKEIIYVKDPTRVEGLQTAERLSVSKYGDCDDKVIMAGSMLRSIGMDVCIVMFNLLNRKSFEHVALMTLLNNEWIMFDPTIENGKVGSQVRQFYQAKIFYIY